MKKHKQLGKLVIAMATAATLLTSSAFATVDYKSVIGNMDNPTNPYGNTTGELVISIKASPGQVGYELQSVQNQEKAFNTLGLKVVDNLLESSLGSVGTYSVDSEVSEFKNEAVQTVGNTYLVTYDGAKYGEVNEASLAISEELESQGYDVNYVEPNYVVQAFGMHPNQEWHYNMIKAPQAWTISNGSSDVKIAVLDTGIDNTHPNLANFVNMSLAKSFVGGDTMDRQKHGTHVSGTIASYGSVSGVMQNASLIPVKVLGDDGRGSTYGIQQGVLYAASIKADVINMSLGGGNYSKGMYDACTTAVNAGVVVVAAAGNNGSGTVSYPAAYSNVIAVGAVNSSRQRADFSQYGTGLEVMAPGEGIYSTVPGGSYDTYDGTSMATPHVAGVAGLIRSVNKSLTSDQVRQILRNTAVNAGPANEYGYGIVDAYAAVQAAGGQIVTPPTSTKTVTSIATDYTTYYRGETINATVTVVDENNNALSGAAVTLKFKKPNGSTSSYSGTTNANGQAVFAIPSTYSFAYGSYTLTATTSLANYEGSTVTKTIKFSSSY